jgi:Arc/MetJ-type ribon-helix-helix transcriptional regulator
MDKSLVKTVRLTEELAGKLAELSEAEGRMVTDSEMLRRLIDRAWLVRQDTLREARALRSDGGAAAGGSPFPARG